LSRLLDKQLKTNDPDQVVWYALSQLEKSHLLEESVARPTRAVQMSRRELIRSLGIAAAVSVPLVTSIVAPTAASAATITCAPDGGKCAVRADCCSPLFCCDGTCCSG
jgi:hypothetical protein